MKKVEIRIDGVVVRNFGITSGTDTSIQVNKFELLLKRTVRSKEMENDVTHIQYVNTIAERLNISPHIIWNRKAAMPVLRAMASAAFVWIEKTGEMRSVASNRFGYKPGSNFSRIMSGHRAYFDPKDTGTKEMVAAREAWAEL